MARPRELQPRPRASQRPDRDRPDRQPAVRLGRTSMPGRPVRHDRSSPRPRHDLLPTDARVQRARSAPGGDHPISPGRWRAPAPFRAPAPPRGTSVWLTGVLGPPGTAVWHNRPDQTVRRPGPRLAAADPHRARRAASADERIGAGQARRGASASRARLVVPYRPRRPRRSEATHQYRGRPGRADRPEGSNSNSTPRLCSCASAARAVCSETSSSSATMAALTTGC